MINGGNVMSEDFKPGVELTGRTNMRMPEETDDSKLTKEETQTLMRVHEDDFIQGLIESADFVRDERQGIEIMRGDKLFFKFFIRPLSEGEYDQCRKKNTKYVRNKQFGMKLPEETNNVKYRTALIYRATVDEDRERFWDNKNVWSALKSKGIEIVTGQDVIAYTLLAGEIEKVIECIDKLSGYDSNLEEVTKN